MEVSICRKTKSGVHTIESDGEEYEWSQVGCKALENEEGHGLIVDLLQTR